MNHRVFLFDLDATVTKEEILPALSDQVGLTAKISELTEKTMLGEIPFKRSFLDRVEMLRSIPVSKVAEIVSNVPLHEEIVDFIRKHVEECYIVTGNLDVWIEKLIKKIGLPMSHCLCSTASVLDNQLVRVNSVIDKGRVVEQFVRPVVAVGDGSNDAEMVRLAEIGIGFGGVRPVAYALMCNATHVIYDEKRLCRFLQVLYKEDQDGIYNEE